MGREIRKVPPHWEHPVTQDTYGRDRKQPMYDEQFEDRFAQWLADCDRIRAGDLTDIERECYPRGLVDWLSDEGQPIDPAYYRPWREDEATWVQLWETVSEGTPVSPPFATKQELAAWLAENGDEWDQDRCRDPHTCRLFGLPPGKPGWGKERAERFVFGAGWAPSLVEAVTKS
jgi:hypothetical protein